VLPDGPERDAVIRQAVKLGLAYMPYKASGHDLLTWLAQPRVQGYVPHPFMRDFWRHVDVAPDADAAAAARTAGLDARTPR
jgi:hypothetical protein